MTFYAQIARYYDAENTDKDDDIPFYLELAEENPGPILDIACGTGREVFPLARAGHTIDGIDIEPAMLERAEAVLDREPKLRKKVKLYQGDVRKDNALPQNHYGLTIVPYNGMMHFHSQEDQLAVLRNLRRWTKDGGLLVLDLPNAGDVYGTEDTDALIFERTFLEPETGHLVMQQSVSMLDRTAQILRVTWIYDEITGDGTLKRTFAPLTLYYYFYSEMRLLLAAAGFEVEEVYGGLDYSDYADGCARMVIFARAV
ncbi:MAG: class I SAM-dependent methyltransferase [Anaerolineae bacterium]|jgi:SAM-dependent methyltransferase|nr:class I SAM-dependent methyltransferase [Anaerolineae bacterium]